MVGKQLCANAVFCWASWGCANRTSLVGKQCRCRCAGMVRLCSSSGHRVQSLQAAAPLSRLAECCRAPQSSAQVNLSSKLCEEPGCTSVRPGYGLPGGSPRFCAAHRLPGMVRHCAGCAKGLRLCCARQFVAAHGPCGHGLARRKTSDTRDAKQMAARRLQPLGTGAIAGSNVPRTSSTTWYALQRYAADRKLRTAGCTVFVTAAWHAGELGTHPMRSRGLPEVCKLRISGRSPSPMCRA